MKKVLIIGSLLFASFAASASSRVESACSDSLALACAKTVYSLPNVRFMHKVRTLSPHGKVIAVCNLPKGLKWNAKRQIVEGHVKEEGRYIYQIKVKEEDKVKCEDIRLTVSKDLQMPRPFMGWISWNAVQDEISESIVKQVVDLFHEKGLYDCGWNYVALDDWWHAKHRASNGLPQPNAQRFPNGIAAVARYVHSHGMKFGIYSDAAETTCAGAFGSYGYEQIDADQYARWGVDLLKYDYCNAPIEKDSAFIRYKAMGDALRKAGNNTQLYACEWGDRQPWTWAAEAGACCWRVSADVRDCWNGVSGGEGLLQSIRDMKNLSAYTGVNRYNDADMLCTALHGTGKSSNDLCGTGPGMTMDEYTSQFALWCMWSSPMALTFDPRSNQITEDDYALMCNRELIALNQDPMGQQADLISENDSILILAKDLENGDVAISATNMNDAEHYATFNFKQIPHLNGMKHFKVRDVVNQIDFPLNAKSKDFTVSVRPHATVVFRLSRKR